MNAPPRRTKRIRQPRNAAPKSIAHIEVSDAEIMASLSRGEIDALGTLYDRYHVALRSFLSRATADSADVDDLVHATFLAAAKSAAKYEAERAPCKAWLIGIAVQHLKRRKSTFGRLLAVIQSLRGIRHSTFDPRNALNAKTDIERALMGISETKRITFLMAEAEGLSCQEIADILDIPIGTVWTRLHGARRELRTILGEESSR